MMDHPSQTLSVRLSEHAISWAAQAQELRRQADSVASSPTDGWPELVENNRRKAAELRNEAARLDARAEEGRKGFLLFDAESTVDNVFRFENQPLFSECSKANRIVHVQPAAGGAY
jgi:hypothetical protein